MRPGAAHSRTHRRGGICHTGHPSDSVGVGVAVIRPWVASSQRGGTGCLWGAWQAQEGSETPAGNMLHSLHPSPQKREAGVPPEGGKGAVRAPRPQMHLGWHAVLLLLRWNERESPFYGEVRLRKVGQQSKVTQLGSGQAPLSPLFWEERVHMEVGMRCIF